MIEVGRKDQLTVGGTTSGEVVSVYKKANRSNRSKPESRKQVGNLEAGTEQRLQISR